MRNPISVKEVQQLTRLMVALSRFVSAGETRGIPISNASRETTGSSGPRSVRNPSSN